MAEVIKTILTADSSELAAEFAKASAIAQKYAAEREAQGSRALQSARAEVEALRLEASGHGAAAAALREKVQLVEQSRRLAERTGISQENALQLATRELALKKQIALEEAATVRSAALAKQAGEEAMIFARERLAAEAARVKRIQMLPQKGAEALPVLALTSANIRQMERANAIQHELNRRMSGAKGAGQTGALGFLALSQAAEDAQYGIKGVLNNIPQMVMGFGAGAGVAGALSLAAVAAVTLYDPMRRLMGLMDAEADSESMKNWAEAAAAAADVIRKLRLEDSLGQQMETLSGLINESLRQRIELQDTSLKFYLEQGKAQQKEIENARLLTQAREKLLEAQGSVVPYRSTAEGAEEITKALENRRNAMKAAQDEEMRLAAILGNVTAEGDEKAAASTRKLLQLREYLEQVNARIAAGGKDLETAEKNKRGGLDRLFENLLATVPLMVAAGAQTSDYNDRNERALLKNLKDNQEARAKVQKQLEEEIALLEKSAGVSKEEHAAAIAKAKERMESMHATNQAAADEIKQLEARLAVEKELARIEEERRKAIRARAESEWTRELEIQKAIASNDLERVRNLERLRDIEAEKRRIMQAQVGITEQEAAKKAAEMVNTRANATAAASQRDFSEELEVLRARAAGENDRAGKLRAAAEMERNILEIMRQQNLTREKASKLARERQNLERQQARGDFMTELKALRMEASGDKAGADRLREEARIRSEAVDLAARLGITESQAQERLRERARLEKQIADAKKSGLSSTESENRVHRSRIYKKFGDEPRLTRDNMGEGYTSLHPRGLAPREIERRNEARTAVPRTPSDESVKILLRSVNIQEEMLGQWKKLSAV